MSDLSPDDLCVEAVLARAPKTDGFPAVTPELLALLKHLGIVWRPLGLYEPRHADSPLETRLPGARASWLCSWNWRGRSVWWLGDAPSHSSVTEETFVAIMRGKALPDGRIEIDGRAMKHLAGPSLEPVLVGCRCECTPHVHGSHRASKGDEWVVWKDGLVVDSSTYRKEASAR